MKNWIPMVCLFLMAGCSKPVAIEDATPENASTENTTNNPVAGQPISPTTVDKVAPPSGGSRPATSIARDRANQVQDRYSGEGD